MSTECAFLVCGLYWRWVSGLFSGGGLAGGFLGLNCSWLGCGVFCFRVVWVLVGWGGSSYAGYCVSVGGLCGLGLVRCGFMGLLDLFAGYLRWLLAVGGLGGNFVCILLGLLVRVGLEVACFDCVWYL